MDAPKPCPTCQKPPHLCVCEAAQPVDNRLFVLVLQHPQEKGEVLATAPLVRLQFKKSLVRIGLSWPSLKRILNRDVDYKNWGVLYLGTAKSKPASDQEVIAVDKNGAPLADQAVLADLEGIVVLDGNWAQAKALWWRNPWMLKCRRLVLNPQVRSRYGKARQEPRRESLSTLESAALVVSRLEGKPQVFDQALKPFDLLLKKYRDDKQQQPATEPPQA
ncbi:MAG TPA: tRNA-uridine aminocarboxypropyltransferase [Azospirillaceae bacterium]|nr:tRNA-uridine aminocarboxypropyltransferase [Azospirillaceae bacterium]